MSLSYSLSGLGYLKLIAHSAKHPSQTAVGLLVGTVASSGSVTIEDAIPLVHHWTSLAMAIEAGLQLVSTRACLLSDVARLGLTAFVFVSRLSCMLRVEDGSSWACMWLMRAWKIRRCR